MMLSSFLCRPIVFTVVLAGAFAAHAQQFLGAPVNPYVTPAPTAATVPAAADLRPTTRLSGHLPAWAQASRDAGAIPDTTVLHLDIVLKRPAARQAAFDSILAAQQDPRSPLFHAWLAPGQIGLLYGPAESDIDSLTAWLTAQGLHVDELTPSRTFVRVSAPAGTVARAFSTSFRLFTLVDGRLLRSATGEPAIPSAFTGLVASIAGLSEATELPASHGAAASLPSAPGATDAAGQAAHPQYTTSSGNHYLTPGDFNTLYDVPATATSGTGQRIAVIGRSQVNPLDITNYQGARRPARQAAQHHHRGCQRRSRPGRRRRPARSHSRRAAHPRRSSRRADRSDHREQ